MSINDYQQIKSYKVVFNISCLVCKEDNGFPSIVRNKAVEDETYLK